MIRKTKGIIINKKEEKVNIEGQNQNEFFFVQTIIKNIKKQGRKTTVITTTT